MTVPIGLTLNPFNNNMFIANAESDTVSVIDSESLEVIATIPVGDLSITSIDSPIEFNPFNNDIYVANEGSNTVSVINSTTNNVTKTIDVGLAPFEPEFNYFDNKMYILNRGDGTVSVIDSLTNTVIDTISVGLNPQNILYNSINHDMYVANTGSDTVSVIDVISGNVTFTISVGSQPRDLELNPENNHVYVANFATSTVSVIDSISNTLNNTLNVFRFPTDLQFNDFNDSIYVAFNSPSSVLVIDVTDTIFNEVGIGRSTFSLEFNPFNTNMYVSTSSLTANNVTMSINSSSNTVIDTIEVGNNPEHLRFNPANNYIYTANRESDSVSVIGPASECDRCFSAESDGGTLPQPRVDELIAYLGDPDNIVPIGADPDVNSIAELCAAIVAAVGTADPVSEQDIRDLLDDALDNAPPGQVQQVIDCLVDAGLFIAVNTFIDSAEDGNGDPVANESSTTSNDINFTFIGTTNAEPDEVVEYGFRCYLDGGDPFSTCSTNLINFIGSKEYNNLAPGPHFLLVKAYVIIQTDSGNLFIEDETPARFDWIILEEPLDTRIDSAEDGNGNPVGNESSTTSDSITFTFSAVNNSTNAEFFCSIDGEEAELCNSGSITYTGLEIGVEHIFRVSAFTESQFDTTPATWVWTIEEEIDTIIDSAEDGNGNPVGNESSTTSDSITFTFSAVNNSTNAEFFCSIDGEEAELCNSGSITYTGLEIGVEHIFRVSAFTESQFDTTPATWVWTIEEEIDTIIDSAEDGNGNPVGNESSTTSDSITFTFSAVNNSTNAEFFCSIDGEEAELCNSGSITYTGLEIGVEHIFRVSAFTESQFDTTPATWVWTIEEEIDTIIDSAEDGNGNPVGNESSTTSDSITFTFSAVNNSTNAEFFCSIDGEEAELCNSGSITYTGLEIGVEHIFRVSAFTESQFDTTPATWVWTIEEEIDTIIDSAEDGNGNPVGNESSTTSDSITFTFSAVNNSTNAEFFCSIDGEEAELCNSGSITYTGLEIGVEHIFRVSAFTESQFDTTPATWVWTIEEEIDTIIDSAEDGNGNPVGNESSTTSDSITFTFSAVNNSTNAEFFCSIDGEEAELCNSGSITYTGLEIGVEHIFRVSAFTESQFDTTPATWVWTIEEEIDTIIDSAEDGNGNPVGNESSTTSDSITFTFSAVNNSTNAEFSCSIDGEEAELCNSGSITYTGLEIGVEHIFRVSAFTESQFDTTPATWVWTVEDIIVNTSIDSQEDGNGDQVDNFGSTTSNDITFEFSGTTNEDDVLERGFICELDEEVIECTDDTSEFFTSSEEFNNLPEGTHTFTVTAFVVIFDGETPTTIEDQSPETFIWTMKKSQKARRARRARREPRR